MPEDVAPGDPAAIAQLALRLHDTADDAASARGTLDRLADGRTRPGLAAAQDRHAYEVPGETPEVAGDRIKDALRYTEDGLGSPVTIGRPR